ncbi:MAG: ATP cone domain-containing protein [Enterocloster bolteae]
MWSTKCVKLNRAVSVEEIQDMVENQIMSTGAFELAKDYVRHRHQRSLIRERQYNG